MKTKTILRKLNKYRICNVGNTYYISSRFCDSRLVKIVDQNGLAVALPLIREKDTDRVAFHAKTINSLNDFLLGGVK